MTITLDLSPQEEQQLHQLAAQQGIGVQELVLQAIKRLLERPQNVAGAPLQKYQAFIDGLLEWPRVSVRARRAREWEDKPTTSTYQTHADFDARMRQFTVEQRQVVADLMQEEHEGGIGTFLAYLEKWQLYHDSVPLAIEPYGTPSTYDLTCRMAGSSWPEPEEEV